MADNLAIQLASLPSMGKDKLSTLWRELYQSPPPEQLRRQLMLRMLAYRIQEQGFRGLNPRARQRIRQMARALARDPAAEISDAPSLKPGTRLLRQWQDRTHIVTVEENGYEYQGSRYQSLSEIARLVTGTRWSGPLFFGLKSTPARTSVAERSK